MFNIAMNGTKHLVLDRRKFLGVAAGLVAAGVIPKMCWPLPPPILSSRAPTMSRS